MKVLVSYPYNDARNLRGELEKWQRLGQLPGVEIVAETEDRRQHGDESIRSHLREALRSCDIVLMLIGNNCHDRPWLDYEAAAAASIGKPVVLVRIPRTTGAAPRHFSRPVEVPWGSASIRGALIAIR